MLRSWVVRRASRSSSTFSPRSRSMTCFVSDGSRSDSPTATRRRKRGHQIAALDLLEHVAAGAGQDGGEQRLVVGVGRQHQALQLGHGRTQVPAHLHTIAIGQADVEHGHVGPARRHPGQRFLGRGALSDHGEVFLGLEELAQAPPDHFVVVEKEHPRGHAAAFMACVLVDVVKPATGRGKGTMASLGLSQRPHRRLHHRRICHPQAQRQACCHPSDGAGSPATVRCAGSAVHEPIRTGARSPASANAAESDSGSAVATTSS